MSEDKNFPYEDIIDLPRHISTKHRPMERQNRAAQFAPFAALVGFGAAITETARLTDGRPVLDDDKKADLDRRLTLLLSLGDAPVCTVTYFRNDDRKEGGSFVSQTGRIVRRDMGRKRIVMDDQSTISSDDIVAIESDIFNISEDADPVY